jgi:bacterioferritin-associated ferredoxin
MKTKEKINSKGQDILCLCMDISKTQVKKLLMKQDFNIEYLYQTLKVGSKCTACLTDLELIINESRENYLTPEKKKHKNNKFELIKHGRHAEERVDSGLFICKGDINTILQLANYNPMFGDTQEAVKHSYHIRLIKENGELACETKGIVNTQQTVSISFKELNNCPEQGWFLIDLVPLKSGFYGTLRPQILLKGIDWAMTSHTQPHIHATYGPNKQARRCHMYIKSIKRKTNTYLSIINAANSPTKYVIELSEGEYFESKSGNINARGSEIVDLDNIFDKIPDEKVLLISVKSTTPTRKHILMKGESGSLSVDHFPNTV